MINSFIQASHVYVPRVVHIRTKGELIAVIAAIIIYFAVNFIMQSKCKNMTQKKINIISVVVAVIAAVFLIFMI